MRILLASLLLAPLCHAAPVPAARPERVREFRPGVYLMYWNNSVWGASFRKDGTYTATLSGSTYYGCWKWDTSSRTLWIHESPKDSQVWRPDSETHCPFVTWKFRLGNSLSGERAEPPSFPFRLVRQPSGSSCSAAVP